VDAAIKLVQAIIDEGPTVYLRPGGQPGDEQSRQFFQGGGPGGGEGGGGYGGFNGGDAGHGGGGGAVAPVNPKP